LILPRTDKEGIPYVSFSQLKKFHTNRNEYYEQYVLNKPFVDNPWAKFGRDVGTALETGDFTNFSASERKILSSVTRLTDFEVEVKLWYDGWYVRGFIDTTDFECLIDYKTGGLGKDAQYYAPDYTQLQLYTLALQQEGLVIDAAWVEFIPRVGNPYRGETLMVDNKPIKRIDMDISPKRLGQVRDETARMAREISEWFCSLDRNMT
jgi:hypothetical protein